MGQLASSSSSASPRAIGDHVVRNGAALDREVRRWRTAVASLSVAKVG